MSTTYTFSGKVVDKAGLTAPWSASVPVGSPLLLSPFGLMGTGTTDPVQARRLIPKTGWSRHVISLIDVTTKASAAQIQLARDAGFRITYTLRWVPAGSGKKATVPLVPGSTTLFDKATYKAQIQKVLAAYPLPDVVVVEDEQDIREQFEVPGDPAQGMRSDAQLAVAAGYYGEFLAANIEVLRPLGVKVADGGIVSATTTHMVYQDLVNRGLQAEADAFWSLAAELVFKKTSGPAYYKQGMAFLTVQKAAGLDYCNFHKYLPDHSTIPIVPVGGMDTIAAFYSAQTGLPIICNEWGVHDPLVTSIQSACAGIKASGMSLAVVYSGGSGESAVSLWNGNVPNASGQALADYITANY